MASDGQTDGQKKGKHRCYPKRDFFLHGGLHNNQTNLQNTWESAVNNIQCSSKLFTVLTFITEHWHIRLVCPGYAAASR